MNLWCNPRKLELRSSFGRRPIALLFSLFAQHFQFIIAWWCTYPPQSPGPLGLRGSWGVGPHNLLLCRDKFMTPSPSVLTWLCARFELVCQASNAAVLSLSCGCTIFLAARSISNRQHPNVVVISLIARVIVRYWRPSWRVISLSSQW